MTFASVEGGMVGMSVIGPRLQDKMSKMVINVEPYGRLEIIIVRLGPRLQDRNDGGGAGLIVGNEGI